MSKKKEQSRGNDFTVLKAIVSTNSARRDGDKHPEPAQREHVPGAFQVKPPDSTSVQKPGLHTSTSLELTAVLPTIPASGTEIWSNPNPLLLNFHYQRLVQLHLDKLAEGKTLKELALAIKKAGIKPTQLNGLVVEACQARAWSFVLDYVYRQISKSTSKEDWTVHDAGIDLIKALENLAKDVKGLAPLSDFAPLEHQLLAQEMVLFAFRNYLSLLKSLYLFEKATSGVDAKKSYERRSQ